MSKLLLTKEMLLESPKLEKAEVETSKGTLLVREMTGTEKEAWEKSLARTEGNDATGKPKIVYDLSNYKAKLVCATVCDEDGNLLFTMREAALVSSAFKASDLEKIVNKAQEINGISTEEKEAMLKNSKAEQEEGSNSNSAENLE